METIKYVEEASQSMKSFYEKTKYEKVSELLEVLNSTFDERLRTVNVFANRVSQIEETKVTFVASLAKVILSNIEDRIGEVFEKLEEFLDRLETESYSFFALEFMDQEGQGPKNLIKEFKKFGRSEDLNALMNSNLKETVRRQNKRLLEKLAVKICFKQPSLRVLEGYKKVLRVILTSIY